MHPLTEAMYAYARMLLLVALAAGAQGEMMTLQNEFLSATILVGVEGATNGLAGLVDRLSRGTSFAFKGDSFSVSVTDPGPAGGPGQPRTLAPGAGLSLHSSHQASPTNVSLVWSANGVGGGFVTAVYSLQPRARVLSKRLMIQLPPATVVDKVALLGAAGVNMSAGAQEVCHWDTGSGLPPLRLKPASISPP